MSKKRAKQGRLFLRPKEQRFVEEYLVDLNATRAAMRAGYSAKTAGQIGYEHLKKPEVQAAVAEGQQRLAANREITKDRIVRELERVGFANLRDFVTLGPEGQVNVDFTMATRDQFAALASLRVDEYMDGAGEDARPVRKVEFKLGDKQGALIHLAKLLGFYQEKTQVSLDAQVLDALQAIEGRRVPRR